MDINPVITHLKAGLAGVRQIGAAADLAAASDNRLVTPALFVLPQGEQAVEDDIEGAFVLRVTFLVVCVVANRRDAVGAAAQSDLDALRDQAHGALAGLLLPTAQVPPRFTRGSLLHFSDGALWWGDEFEVDLFI